MDQFFCGLLRISELQQQYCYFTLFCTPYFTKYILFLNIIFKHVTLCTPTAASVSSSSRSNSRRTASTTNRGHRSHSLLSCPVLYGTRKAAAFGKKAVQLETGTTSLWPFFSCFNIPLPYHHVKVGRGNTDPPQSLAFSLKPPKRRPLKRLPTGQKTRTKPSRKSEKA